MFSERPSSAIFTNSAGIPDIDCVVDVPLYAGNDGIVNEQFLECLFRKH